MRLRGSGRTVDRSNSPGSLLPARESNAGRVMIPMRCRSPVFVTTRIARVEQSRRSIGKHVGLRIAGRKAGYTHPVVLEVGERSLGVVSDTIGQRQRTR